MYDLVVIGSGPAGHIAALEAARRKYKTALIEKDLSMLGGVCLNEGCVPLKGLLHYSLNQKDCRQIREKVMAKVASIRQGLLGRIRNAGVEIIDGEAKFISKNDVTAGGRQVKGKYFLVAAGSQPRRLFEKAMPPESIFGLEKNPRNALIIGGGVIGCEYASYLSNLGAEVTIAEAQNSILLGEDEEALRALSREFKKKKITVLAPAKVEVLSAQSARIASEGGQAEAKFDVIIEATGRVPRTAGLGLEAAGVETDEKGYIKVNEYMQSSNRDIYAAGDCVNTPMLAYAASAEAELAVAHMSTEDCAAIDYRIMPKLVFSSPQLGSIGLSEAKAVEKGEDFRVYRYFFKAMGKASVEGRDAGLIKILADKNSGRIIGASVVGEEAAEIMNELSVIMSNRLTRSDVIKSLHIHPSYGEIIAEALKWGG